MTELNAVLLRVNDVKSTKGFRGSSSVLFSCSKKNESIKICFTVAERVT
jgi:hypothetical protein